MMETQSSDVRQNRTTFSLQGHFTALSTFTFLFIMRNISVVGTKIVFTSDCDQQIKCCFKKKKNLKSVAAAGL